MMFNSNRKSPALLLVAFGVLILCQIGYAQRQDPLNFGELNVFIDRLSSTQIRITAGTVFGSKNDSYPVMNRWNSYTKTGTFYGNHIDRAGGPNGDTIGYSSYSATFTVTGFTFTVDFRDMDYPGSYTNRDVYITYYPDSDKAVRTDCSPTRNISNNETIGIWENGNKSSGTPRVLANVRTSFGGGIVTIDGGDYSSPFTQGLLANGSHSISAPSSQTVDGISYSFTSWSDGGAKTHSLSVTTSIFGSTYTANYSGKPVAVTVTSAGGPNGDPVVINWQAHANSGVTYDVYRKIRHNGVMGDPVLLASNLSHSTTSYTDYDWLNVGVSSDILLYDIRAYSSALGAYADPQWVTAGYGQIVPKINTPLANGKAVPSEYFLSSYPNPFNPATQVSYALPTAGYVQLTTHDMLGREVVHLAEGFHQAGYHNVTWNAQNAASGLYFARLTVTNELGKTVYTKTNKLLLTR